MTRFANQSVAVFAAVLLSIVSINALVTVPPASAVVVSAPVLA